MKKIFLILFIALAMGVQAQTGVTLIRESEDVYLVRNYDMSTLSGSDTSFTFSVRMPVNRSWSIQVFWTGVTGSGTLALEVTNFKNLVGWIPYTGSLSATITGARDSAGWEDDMFAWDYGRLKLTKGTLSAGGLTVIIRVK